MNRIKGYKSFDKETVINESNKKEERQKEIEKMVRNEVKNVYDHKAVPLFNYNKPVLFVILKHRKKDDKYEFDIQSLMGDRLLLRYDGEETVEIVNVGNNNSKVIPTKSSGKLTKWALDEYLKKN